MPTDPATSFFFSTSLGMNNRYNELDFSGQYVLLAQNARFAQMPGSVIKRDPLAYYNPTSMSTTSGVVGLYRFYSAFGPELIVTCGSTVYVGNDSTGVMTPIQTLSNANRPMMFVTYDQLLIGSNGYDPIFVYDGSPDNVCWQLGSCQAVIGNSTGITATNISYAVTLDGDALITGAISNTIASATNQSINLAYIPLGPVGTTNRKIYRKDSNTSNEYLLVDTISDNSTTTYTDTTPSASLGAQMGDVTDPIPMGAWILIFGERLFITADPNNLNRIYYSEPYLPNYIQVNTNLDYMDVAKDDGDQIQGIAVETGTMICIKQNNMRKLNISTAQSNVDPATWSAEEPFSYIGTPARYSICQTQFGIVLLSWDFWYQVIGLQPKPIIPQFDTTQILPSAYNNVVSGYNDGMLYASYTSIASGDQFPTQVMVYDFKLDQMGLDTYSAGAFASGTGVNESGQLYIGDATQGFVYEISRGDLVYSLSSLSQAQQGTGTNIFIGGTQNDAFIQIGADVSPTAIPTGICLFWDDTVALPGPGWTEITIFPYTYPVISAIPGNISGGSSSHVHLLTGITSTDVGPSGNSGNGNNQANGYPHYHTVSGNSDGMFADPNFFGLRVFYKNSVTTEYEFPVGSILMWDQATSPDNWIPYAQSNNGYLKLISPVSYAPNWVVGTAYAVGALVTAPNPFSGVNTIYYCQIAHTAGYYDTQFNYYYGQTGDYLNLGLDNTPSPNIPASGAGGTGTYPVSITFGDDLAAGFWIPQYSNLGITQNSSHAHPYGVITPFRTGDSPITNNVSDQGNLGPLNAHQHFCLGVTNAASTAMWDLDRIEVNFIKKLITGETPWDGTSKNIVALYYDSAAEDLYTLLLLHFDNNLTDSSDYNHLVTNVGNVNVTFSNSVYKFSQVPYSAIFSDASEPGTSLSVGTPWTFGTENWTVECQIYMPSVGSPFTIYAQGVGDQYGNDYCIFGSISGSDLNVQGKTSGSLIVNVTASVTFSSNTWYHIAFVRNGTNILIFLNGILQSTTGTQIGTASISTATTNITIGNLYPISEGGFTGNMDEVRVSNIARYTTSFTPPTVPFYVFGVPTNNWSDISSTVLAYSSTTNYLAGNMVVYNNVYYSCIQNAINQEPDTSPLYWQGGLYSSSTAYVIGQYATYNQIGYACIQNATNQEPDISTAYWQPITLFLKSKQNYLTPQANNGFTHNHGNTPAITTSWPIQVWDNSGYEAQTGLMHQHTLFCTTNTVSIPNPAWTTFRLWAKPLGQMTTWNEAVDTEFNNGLYYSPPLQLNIASFDQIYFNAKLTGSDQINFYFRTAATQNLLGSAQTWDSASTTWDSANPYDYLASGIACTLNYTTGYFTATAHGLVAGNRISLTAATMPTGLSGAIMYYVLYVDANDFQVSLTNGGSAVSFSTNGSGVVAFQWFDEISLSGTTITATPNVWIQYAIEFIAANTEAANPTLYTANEYMMEFGYSRVGGIAESAVEFIYSTGRMNYGEPYVDKIFKRFASDHTGTTGQVQITWATENATNSWTFDLSQYPSKWTAYFHDSAMGETLNITYYKNDLNAFNLRQFKGQYTPQPMII